MHYIAIAVIIASLIAIAYRDLKLALVSLALILLAALVFYFLSPEKQANRELVGYVVLTESDITRGYANGYVLSARIQNQHDSQTLQKVVIQSSLSDCNADKSQCLTIGEEQHVVKARIPPGQARDTQINLRMRQLNPIRGEAVWEHTVVGVN